MRTAWIAVLICMVAPMALLADEPTADELKANSQQLADPGTPAVGVGDPAVKRPIRSKLTVDLGLGFAITELDADLGGRKTKIGVAPLSASVGHFFNERWALMLRSSGTAFFEKAGGATRESLHSFFGVVGEVWPSDRFSLTAGPGLAVLTTNIRPFEFISDDADYEAGLGFSIRAAYSVYTEAAFCVRLALELLPGFYDSATVVGEAVTVELKIF